MVPVIRSEELAPPTDWRPTPSGRSVNPFRLTSSFPGRAMALSPNTESSSRLSTPSIPLRCRCCWWPLSAVRGRSVKPESVKRVSFSFSPLRFQCAVAQRFPGLDARTRTRGPWRPWRTVPGRWRGGRLRRAVAIGGAYRSSPAAPRRFPAAAPLGGCLRILARAS